MESLYELSEIGMNIRSKADWWLGELKLSRDRAEAKLRELADAAEWRDECEEDRAITSWWNGKNYANFLCYVNRAEADYQAALKAAKEE